MKKSELTKIKVDKCLNCNEIVTECDNCKSPIIEKEVWCKEDTFDHICMCCKEE